MSTNIGYIPLESIVSDWLSTTGHEGFYDTFLILKSAQDETQKLVRGDQVKEYVTLLTVEDYTSVLPKNFHAVVQAAYNIFPHKPCLKSEVVEFSKPVYGTDKACEMKIRLDCDTCSPNKCNCNRPFIEIDANDMWLRAHPEHVYGSSRHFYSYTNLTEYPGYKHSSLHPQFRLMGVKSGSFHNLNYHISECLNLNLDTDISYDIDIPNIVVNFKEGQILLSYFGHRIDEQGRLLIPNLPEAIEAITLYIESREAFREYRRSKKPADRIYYAEVKREYEIAHNKARAILERPSSDKIRMIWRNHMSKLLPYDNWESNLNRKQNDRFRYPNQSGGLIF